MTLLQRLSTIPYPISLVLRPRLYARVDRCLDTQGFNALADSKNEGVVSELRGFRLDACVQRDQFVVGAVLEQALGGVWRYGVIDGFCHDGAQLSVRDRLAAIDIGRSKRSGFSLRNSQTRARRAVLSNAPNRTPTLTPACAVGVPGASAGASTSHARAPTAKSATRAAATRYAAAVMGLACSASVESRTGSTMLGTLHSGAFGFACSS